MNLRCPDSSWIVHVYIYIHTHICVYVYIYVHTHTYIPARTLVYMVLRYPMSTLGRKPYVACGKQTIHTYQTVHTFTNTCMHACIYIYIYIYIYLRWLH